MKDRFRSAMALQRRKEWHHAYRDKALAEGRCGRCCVRPAEEGKRMCIVLP